MNKNVDVYVCGPGVGVNRSKEAVFIQFEIFDASTFESTGKTHTVLMSTADAMILMRQLERAQQALSLPIPIDELPPMIEFTDKRKN